MIQIRLLFLHLHYHPSLKKCPSFPGHSRGGCHSDSIHQVSESSSFSCCWYFQKNRSHQQTTRWREVAEDWSAWNLASVHSGRSDQLYPQKVSNVHDCGMQVRLRHFPVLHHFFVIYNSALYHPLSLSHLNVASLIFRLLRCHSEHCKDNRTMELLF